jgi:hypothetical protein
MSQRRGEAAERPACLLVVLSLKHLMVRGITSEEGWASRTDRDCPTRSSPVVLTRLATAVPRARRCGTARSHPHTSRRASGTSRDQCTHIRLGDVKHYSTGHRSSWWSHVFDRTIVCCRHHDIRLSGPRSRFAQTSPHRFRWPIVSPSRTTSPHRRHIRPRRKVRTATGVDAEAVEARAVPP